MKIKLTLIVSILILLTNCGGGGGPSSPVIIQPPVTAGTGTVTGPSVPVLTGNTFDITIDSDVTSAMLQVELVISFQSSLISTVPTVSIVGGLFDDYQASFKNNDPAQGLRILLFNSSFGTSTGPGRLCVVTFNVDTIASTQTSISFAGSSGEFGASPGSFSTFTLSSISVDLN